MSPIPLQPPVRVHPFTGLVIDVDTWATAHDYHRRHQQLHLLTGHGSGVASGLEVLPTDPPSDSVVIEPGVAVDPQGNVIVVPERQQIALGTEAGPCYIVLDYVESIPTAAEGENQDMRARVLEDFRLRVLHSLPEAPAIELARVDLATKGDAVIAAPNPWAPENGQIDLRNRPRMQSSAPREMTVALLIHGDEAAMAGHVTGFQYWVRELGYCGVRANVIRPSGAAIPAADLLYVTAAASEALPPAIIKGIGEHVTRGAWLFADSCGEGTEMLDSMAGLLKTRKASSSHTEELILGSRFVFGEPPPGASANGKFVWGENAVLSPRDYGCAWYGRHNGKSFSREHIRAALEFGVNVAYGVGSS
jgi:hypothetical protein